MALGQAEYCDGNKVWSRTMHSGRMRVGRAVFDNINDVEQVGCSIICTLACWYEENCLSFVTTILKYEFFDPLSDYTRAYNYEYI